MKKNIEHKIIIGIINSFLYELDFGQPINIEEDKQFKQDREKLIELLEAYKESIT